jgi:hypothetical protein
MKLFVVACLMLGTGCLWASETSQSLVGYSGHVTLDDHGHVEGAGAHVTGGYAGLLVDGELAVRDVARTPDPVVQPPPGPPAPVAAGPDTGHAAALGLSLRGSLLGILSRDHRLERYFDIGADAGANYGAAFGLPRHDIEATASAWYGAWTELGTINAGNGYLALTGGIRRESFAGPYVDQTQLMIGIAWRQRETVAPSNLNIHD